MILRNVDTNRSHQNAISKTYTSSPVRRQLEIGGLTLGGPDGGISGGGLKLGGKGGKEGAAGAAGAAGNGTMTAGAEPKAGKGGAMEAGAGAAGNRTTTATEPAAAKESKAPAAAGEGAAAKESAAPKTQIGRASCRERV